jgi:hypothetical protein
MMADGKYKFINQIISILLICVFYSCTDKEEKHLLKKLSNGVIVDLYIHGEDVGFNDVSYTRDITLKKQNKKLKLDLGKSQWPGGYVVFHSFKISNTDSIPLMVFFNYHYDDNIFKIVDPTNLVLIEDTAILNQVGKISQLNDDKIYWGDFEQEAIKLRK